MVIAPGQAGVVAVAMWARSVRAVMVAARASSDRRIYYPLCRLQREAGSKVAMVQVAAAASSLCESR